MAPICKRGSRPCQCHGLPVFSGGFAPGVSVGRLVAGENKQEAFTAGGFQPVSKGCQQVESFSKREMKL